MLENLSSKVFRNVLSAVCMLPLVGCSTEVTGGGSSSMSGSGGPTSTGSSATNGSSSASGAGGAGNASSTSGSGGSSGSSSASGAGGASNASSTSGSGGSPGTVTLPCGYVVDTSNPVLIKTPADLVNLSSTGKWKAYFKLQNDIDMMGVAFTPGSLNGSLFDGAGFTISNLTVTSNEYDYNGLFRQTSCSTVENLTLSHPQVTLGYSSCSAIVVGYAVDTSIDNVTLSAASISGVDGYSAGGVIGCAYGKVTVAHVSADVEINLPTSLNDGGFIGEIAGGASVIVSDSTFSGSIVSTQCVGGIIGVNAGSGSDASNAKLCSVQLSNVNVTGSVKQEPSGWGNDVHGAGGIVGCDLLSQTTITGANVTGPVAGVWGAGGIIGQSYQPEPSMAPTLSDNSWPQGLPQILEVSSSWW